jgi:hypothetical protein
VAGGRGWASRVRGASKAWSGRGSDAINYNTPSKTVDIWFHSHFKVYIVLSSRARS